MSKHIIANITWMQNGWKGEPTENDLKEIQKVTGFDYVKQGNIPHESYNFSPDAQDNQYKYAFSQWTHPPKDFENGKGIIFFYSNNQIVGCFIRSEINNEDSWKLTGKEGFLGEIAFNIRASKENWVIFDKSIEVGKKKERYFGDKEKVGQIGFIYIDDEKTINILEDAKDKNPEQQSLIGKLIGEIPWPTIGLVGGHRIIDRYIYDYARKIDCYGATAMWWSQLPTNEKKTIPDLEKRLNRKDAVFVYYGYDTKARFRVKVKEFKKDEGCHIHPEKWRKEFGWPEEDESDENGKRPKQPEFWWLIDDIEEIDPPVDYEKFNGGDFKFPIYGNLQPFFKEPLGILTRSLTERTKMKKLRSLVLDFKQIILQGPPGTGKTYQAKRLAAHILGMNEQLVSGEEKGEQNKFSQARFNEKSKEYPDGAWSIVQFHPAYNYEDFVRGIQVKTEAKNIERTDEKNGERIVTYNTVNKILGQMADAAKFNPSKDFILIIDEINRANLAAVLGELIYALEYRGCEVDTPYEIDKKRSILIPPNLYIIGTMNTADRSIGHIDYAVRRRFAFVPCLPDKTVIEQNGNKLALDLYDAVAKLFVKDPSKENSGRAETLSPEFHPDDLQIGHTYFMCKKDNEEEANETLEQKFIYQVYPLIREYYKDGILIKDNDGKLSINIKGKEGKITIDEPMRPEDIRQKLEGLTSTN